MSNGVGAPRYEVGMVDEIDRVRNGIERDSVVASGAMRRQVSLTKRVDPSGKQRHGNLPVAAQR